jgi:hypothetical protein
MAHDVLDILGEGARGPVEVTSVGAYTVRFVEAGAPVEVPAWKVTSIALEAAVPALQDGLALLGAGAFDEAIATFGASIPAPGQAETPGVAVAASRAWCVFHAANAQRVRADVLGRGHEEAARLLAAYVQSHADDLFVARALFAQGLCWLSARRPDDARRAFMTLADARFGPVWPLYARLGRARVTLLEGQVEAALRAYDAIHGDASEVEHADEVVQLASAWKVEALLATGDAEGALGAVPRRDVPTERQEAASEAAVFSHGWLGSAAAAPLLNAIGEAMALAAPGAAGAAAALPFHLRVLRYHPSHHAEAARALACAARGLKASGQGQDGEQVLAMLLERYPGSRFATAAGPGGLGGDGAH